VVQNFGIALKTDFQTWNANSVFIAKMWYCGSLFAIILPRYCKKSFRNRHLMTKTWGHAPQ